MAHWTIYSVVSHMTCGLDRLIYHMHEFHLDTETSNGGSLILSIA